MEIPRYLGTTNYLYDDINVVEELDSSGNALARYTHGSVVDEDLSSIRGGATAYYQADGLGSITSLSNATAALTNTYTHDSSGNLIASTGTLVNPFQYTGREFDSETGIYQYRFRYYDPNAGRFIREDPIRFRGGINMYSYAMNNPTGQRDPSGLAPQKPYDVLAAHGRSPNSIPGLCHPSPALQSCLEKLFGQTLPIYITPYSNAPSALLGYNVSGYGTIDLPGGCDDFFKSNFLVLHEYYHVVYQWQYHPATFIFKYGWEALKSGFDHDSIPSEQEADAFADGPAYQTLTDCLKNHTCSK